MVLRCMVVPGSGWELGNRTQCVALSGHSFRRPYHTDLVDIACSHCAALDGEDHTEARRCLTLLVMADDA